MKKRFKKIYIEITNVCNLNCNFCPKTSRTPEYMSESLYKKAIDESKQLAEEITLHVMGEPLLHPEIEKIIHYAQKQDVKINLTTNGILVHKYSQILLNKTIKRINFSIHSLNENYSEEDARKHLTQIIDFTKLAQKERTDLIIVYRLWNINNSANKNILDIIQTEFNTTLKDEKNKIGIEIKPNLYINYDESFNWPNVKNEVKNQTGYCLGLKTHIGILSNGIVVPCCLDNDGNIPLGNIKNNTLNEILNSKKSQDILNGFKERKLIEDLCKRCSYIQKFNK
ncbi:MAG: radical SAM protein [Candidatus Nanoarchaeia archaeon]|nr:radical SAM protein [Candidatus Nanoarchaeia archaeon]